MDYDWSAADLAFRDEVRAFLDAKLTPELRRAGRLATSVYPDHEASMEWQHRLHERGWAAPAWPVEHGGCDWSLTQHYIFGRESTLAGAPTLSPMGIKMVAPAIIAFGTPEQKSYYLPRILTGEIFFCQGYSEPEAGSDLAALSMAAVDDGDDFLCTGSKIWTTHATEANWIFCLVRTSREGKKQQGITFLLIDMTTPGIEVRPLVMTSGEEVQNQVFFDNVRVPKSNVLGQIDHGWTVAKYLLVHERGGAVAPMLQTMAKGLADAAAEQTGPDGNPLIDDPAFSARLADARIRTEVLEILEYRTVSAMAQGKDPGPASSMLKVIATELSQQLTELALIAAGPRGRVYQPHATAPGGPVTEFTPPADGYRSGAEWQAVAPLRYFNDRAGSIYAGSNEIQRNILAKAALGL
ncbi:acyl-CoA dehydrogenase family protein [Nocardia sp. NPDC005366]|uniref:acyl-CoA dehydrogenase family protein n=1 Tax=Nocardia sp. NPDC005366 TaxID=3156878 RepID=UPI0033B50B10